MKKNVIIAILLTVIFLSDAFAASIAQVGYRWRSDGGTELSALYKEEKNLPTSVEQNKNIRLRFEIGNTGMTDDSRTVQFEYGSSTAGPWSPVPVSGPTSEPFVMSDTTWYMDGDYTTQQISTGGVFEPGLCHDMTNIEDLPMLISYNGVTEPEFCFQATDDSLIGKTYYFRLSGLDGYNFYPELTVLAPSFTPTPTGTHFSPTPTVTPSPVAVPVNNNLDLTILLLFGITSTFLIIPGRTNL